ncbi:major facilitator superfamily domain-containing protein [Hysterangium stoloniferum]|nr:major facilitator superfamily domain-containing protein [Hysterangium stoloniferum]
MAASGFTTLDSQRLLVYLRVTMNYITVLDGQPVLESKRSRRNSYKSIGPQIDCKQSQADKVYDRFTPTHKRLITCLVAMSGLVESIVVESFLPCVPAVAKDFDTTGVVIPNVIGLSKMVRSSALIFSFPAKYFHWRAHLCQRKQCASAARWTRFSSHWGSMLGDATSILPIGANVISDLYKLEERGTAIGFFLGATLFGHLIAPVLGGWLATYSSWRVVPLGTATIALIDFVIVVLFLPETSHPGMRGVEKIRMAENLRQDPSVQSDRTGWRFILLNPLRILLLLKNSILVNVSLSVSFATVAHYGVMVPLSYTIGPRYGMTSPSLIGLCFLPAGLGDIAYVEVNKRKQGAYANKGKQSVEANKGKQDNARQGKWFPEDRLLAAIPGLLFLTPCALITLGLSIAFIPGNVGLTISLICLFFNAMGVHSVIGPCSTYLVDLFPSQGAEFLAVVMAARNAFGAITTIAALPIIHQFGIITTYNTMAVLVWLGCILLYVTIRNGDRLRAWVNTDGTALQAPL